MSGEHAITELKAKRAELEQDIKTTEARLAWLRDGVSHVDAALQLIDSDFNPIVLKPMAKRNAVQLFKTGYLSRFILKTLRVRGPMDMEALTLTVMLDAGMDVNDALMRSETSRRLRYALRDQTRTGRIVRKQEPGQSLVWQLAH